MSKTSKTISEARSQPQQSTEPQEPAVIWRHERWILYILAVLVIILDQYTKEIVRTNMPLYTSWAPIPGIENFFQITHTTNTGVAFGLFQNGNTIFAIFVSLISIGIVVFNQRLSLGNLLLRVALGLQLGGALGNLIDRVTQGYVTDFLDFGLWPVFNVADMAVVSGVILLAFIMLQEDRRERAQQQEETYQASKLAGSAADFPEHDESSTA